MLRVPAPTIEQISQVLFDVANRESIELPPALVERISLSCVGNLRKALLMLEAMYVQKYVCLIRYPFAVDQTLPTTDWEQFINEIASSILRHQNPEMLHEIRTKLYQLLANCIPPEVVLKRLALSLLSGIDSALKPEIIKVAAEYEHRMRMGNKAIFHLEAFVAKVMSVYAQYLIDIGA
jgi:replication factor C subunit 3/5